MDLNNMTKEDIIGLPTHDIAFKFPYADEEEFKLLKENIKENGVQVPIIIYEEKILDGRNRHKAVLELYEEDKTWNKIVRFEEYTGTIEPELYADSLNLVRRHLSAGQRAILAVDVYADKYEEFKQAAKKRKQAGKKTENIDLQQKFAEGVAPTAADELGLLVGTNRTYIQKAEKIKKNIPELLHSVYDGTIDIDTASKIASITKTEQLEQRNKLVEGILAGTDFKTLKEQVFPPVTNKNKANIPGKLGIFFSFHIPPTTIQKIVELLHDEKYLNQDYAIWVGQDVATREKVEALKDTLKLKTHSMEFKHE